MALKTVLPVAFLLLLAVPAFADGPDIRNAEDAHQVGPLQTLTNEAFLDRVQFVLGVAVALHPATRTAKTFADLGALFARESVKAADFRNEIVQSHLLVVSAEADRLEAIAARDHNLRSDEAQAILADLRRGHFSDDTTAMFLAKSVFSRRMVYGLASRYAVDRATGAVGKRFSQSIPTGNRIEMLWVGRRSPVRQTGISWRHLTAMGASSRKLTNAFQTMLLQRIGRRIGRYALESTLDRYAEEVLRDHPSIPEAANYFRLNVMIQPQAMVAFAQAQPAELAAIVMPTQLVMQRDSVVRAADLQLQIIEEQHYEVSSGVQSTTYNQPVEDHPTHRVPPSINIPGGSFTGGSGSTLFSRY